MPVITRDGIEVEYLEEGAGPLVVLLHSSVSGNRQWRRLMADLSPRYRCVAPNLLGYGQTSAWHNQRKQTLADAAAVALAVCDLADGPVRLVGHSWGASVALSAAQALGPQVTHLALYEPMLIGLLAGHGREIAMQEADEMYSLVRTYGDAGNWLALAEAFTDYFNGAGTWEAAPADRRAAVASQLPPNRHEWDAGAPAITTDQFTGIQARTLIMRGSQTRLVLRETSELLIQAFPEWELCELAGAGHMGPLTHAPKVHGYIEKLFAT